MGAKKKIIEVIEPQDDPDFLVCMDYLRCVEFDRMTQEAFAQQKGIDRITLWRWVSKWKAKGLIQKCRATFALAVFDEVIVTNRRVVMSWPTVAEEMLRISLEANSEYTRFQTGSWLYEHIVEPTMKEVEEPGHEAADYLRSIEGSELALDPMSVVKVRD